MNPSPRIARAAVIVAAVVAVINLAAGILNVGSDRILPLVAGASFAVLAVVAWRRPQVAGAALGIAALLMLAQGTHDVIAGGHFTDAADATGRIGGAIVRAVVFIVLLRGSVAARLRS